jgi:hypothetical protein
METVGRSQDYLTQNAFGRSFRISILPKVSPMVSKNTFQLIDLSRLREVVSQVQ